MKPKTASRRRFGGDVRVRVESVQRARSARTRDSRRRPGRSAAGPSSRIDVREHDRGEQRRERQRSRGREHEQVARAHAPASASESRCSRADAEAAQRPRQPRRPAAAAGRHVLRRAAGRSGRDQQHARERSPSRPSAPSTRASGAGIRAPPARPPARGRVRAPRARAVSGSRPASAHCCVCPPCKRPTWSIACAHSRARRRTSSVPGCRPALIRPRSGVPLPLCDAATANAPRHGLPARAAS